MTAIDFIDDRQIVHGIINGYKQLVMERFAEGWSPSIVTMMFKQLRASPDPVLAQMFDEADRVYRSFVTFPVRRPSSPGSVGRLPIMIAVPDLPVGKRGKPQELVAVNDGLHLHGVLLVPPGSRLRVTAAEHFRAYQPLYVGDRSRVDRVDVRTVERDVLRAVDYVFKGLPRRRFSLDDVRVWPAALDEVRE